MNARTEKPKEHKGGRTRVYLTAQDPVLEGKYRPDAEHVHILCDSSYGAFSVTLPDVGSAEHREFIFYNMPLTTEGATVTVVSKPGQFIHVDQTSHDLAPGDTVGFVSALRSKNWMVSDINSGGGGGVTDHRLLSHLNSTSYWHLTQAQASELTGGGNTALHYHDADKPSGFTGTITFVE